MKRYIYSVFVFLLFYSYLVAAPNVSYIIPDIGTPGLATYMEIITNTDGYGNFGVDRKVDNPLSDPSLKIEFQDPNDSKKITFGPLVVSWHGRMIATNVFVNPNLPEPNSSDWEQLTNSNKVIFRLYANGTTSSWITFYIVKPYYFGDLSNNNTDIVFGQGSLGKRSPRGCMIVEELSLNNITYTVSTADCDPYLEGNQGYLPFVLLSKNDIIGKNEGGIRTQFSVSANGKNAGPGGGGGGGKFCDASVGGYGSRDGENGGDGFVGGGPGGGNKSAIPFGVTDHYKSWGNGTGVDNGSINGVLRPRNINAYENSGGATGHPFGFSGRASYVASPSSENNDGGFGGGSGSGQATKSGGGGYSTIGAQSNPFNYGRIHGNKYVVPIAGGSCGAGGNPQGMGNCSGNGGGGGGAIRVFANRIENIIISAKGGNGGDGDGDTDGGGGSGGYVGVFSKIIADGVTLEANGGTTGGGANPPVNGAGRARLDVMFEALTTSFSPNPNDIPEASYRGFASDTTHLVARLCTITGKKQDNDILELYLKGENEANWRLINTTNAASQNWSVDLDLRNGSDSVYYFFALKQIASKGKLDSVQYAPAYDYSQAAFNILKIDKFPEIAGDTVLNIDAVLCEGTHPTGKFKIYNNGEANLELNLENAYFLSGENNFSFLPNDNISINPKDSVEITVTYLNPVVGNKKDTLRIRHNDAYAHTAPSWFVVINANVSEHKLAFTDLTGNNIDTLDFGVICIDDVKYAKASIKNLSNGSVHIDSLSNIKYGSGFSYELKNIVLQNLNDTIQVSFRFDHSQEGKFYEKVYVYSDGCTTPKDSIILAIESVIPKIVFDEPIHFGNICKGSTKQLKLLITNPTALSYDLSLIEHNIFPGINITHDDGNGILAPFSSKTITISVNSIDYPLGLSSAKLSFASPTCRNLEDIDLDFNVIKTDLSAIEKELDFGLVRVGLSKELTGTIKNINYGIAHIEKLPKAKAPFEVLSSVPIVMTDLLPSEELRYTASFSPTIAGAFRDTIEFESVAFGTDACPANVKVILIGNASQPEVIVSRNAIDFGLVADCKKPTDTVFIKNVGKFDVLINKAEITGADRNHFSIVSPDGNTSYTLKPNEEKIYTIRYNSEVSPMGVHNAELSFISDLQLPKVKLKGESENIDVSISPYSPLNIGAVPVNDNKNVEIIFKNNSRQKVKIVNISSDDPNLVLSVNELTLEASESMRIIADIKVINEGNNQYEIKYLIESPCPEAGSYIINANGIQGKIDLTANLDFGVLAPCENKDSLVIITNTGYVPVKINSINIIGTDKDLFIYIAPPEGQNFPFYLAPGGIYTIKINFNPTGVIDGVKTAQLAINAEINGVLVDLVSQLKGERQSGLLQTPNLLDFASIATNSTKQMNIKLENNGTFNINLISIKLLNQDGIFKIHTPISNLLLPINATQNINISFAPKEIFAYSNKLIIYYEVNDCLDSMIIDLIGKGRPANVVNLRLPEILNQDPKVDRLDIPIYAKLLADNIEELKNINLDFDVSFNATLYTANEVSSGTLENLINSNTHIRTLRIKLLGVNLTNEEKIIGIIKGFPLLGDVQSTSLDILNPQTDNTIDISSITVNSGALSYIICNQGGNRLINYKEPLTMKVNPNPSRDYLNIEVTPLEKGNHKLEFVNSLGQVVKTINFVNSGMNENKFNYLIDLTEYSSGVYMLILIGPNQVSNNQIRIIK